MKKLLSAIFMALVFSLSLACRIAPAVKAPSDYEAVKRTIEQSIGWAIEKDFDSMFRLWADDMFHFRLFSDSTVVGLDNG